MKKIKLVFLLIYLFTANLFSQSTLGYWDTVRTTNETVTLSRGEKKYIKTTNFPAGTTELVYRITLLDNNQKVASSLVSVLKAIPDPSGISQGSAGAILLLSTISGNDKCKYAIFINQNDADEYLKSGKTTNSCSFQNIPINKQAKLISINSKCFNEKIQNLYFAFSSENWIMNEKIVIEIVPWINNNASRGWNNSAKKEILNRAKTAPEYKLISKKDQFAANFIEQISQKFTYADFSQLLEIEKQNEVALAIEQSLNKIGQKKLVLKAIQNQAQQLFDNNDSEKAIELLQTEIIDKNAATALDYNQLGYFYLFSKQFEKALQAFLIAEKLDETELKIKLNLAHLYLFTSKISKAKAIHEKFKSQNISPTKSWKQQTNDDFKLLEQKGFSTSNFKKIIRILN